jgi:phage-related minor tail protein
MEGAMADPFDSELASLSGVSAELERISKLSDGVGTALAKALRGAVAEGGSLKSVLAEVSESLAQLALKAAFAPLGDLVSSALNGLYQATNPAVGGVTAFAKGGVLASPTYFPLGQGFGLAGEAGAEAVMPLTRGADGRLGVATGGGGAVNVTFNVTAQDARSFARSEAELSAMLLRAVKRGRRGS